MDVIAVLCSDLHIQMKPPVARSAEDDWPGKMEQYFTELRAVCEHHGAPLVVAGDIFDRWNAPPEAIMFAMRVLPPKTYAIPGQHDLPNHDYKAMDRSAYGVLKETGVITDLEPGVRPYLRPDLQLHPFPWGYPIKPLSQQNTPKGDRVHLAVAHKYIWKKGAGYPGAPKEARVGNLRKQLRGYDAAVFGDNHKGFLIKGGKNGPSVLNCGGFMCRRIDERAYQPRIGLLHRNGSITEYLTNRNDDKFIDVDELGELASRGLDMTKFIGSLSELGSEGIDYLEAVRRYLDDNNITGRIKELVLEATHGGQR